MKFLLETIKLAKSASAWMPANAARDEVVKRLDQARALGEELLARENAFKGTTDQAAAIYAEFGFRAHERGNNLQAMRENLGRLLSGEPRQDERRAAPEALAARMVTHVGGERAGKTYTAASLEDIADMLGRLAKDQRDMGERQQTQREARLNLGQAMAYEDAARILRDTALTGEPRP